MYIADGDKRQVIDFRNHKEYNHMHCIIRRYLRTRIKYFFITREEAIKELINNYRIYARG